MGTGKGLQFSRYASLGYWAGIPNQHRQLDRLPRRMRIGATQRELSRGNGEGFLALVYVCVSHADWCCRYGNTVAHVLYKSDDGLWWGKSTRLHQRMKFICFEFGRPGTHQAVSFSGALHDFDEICTKFLVPAN